MTAGTPAKEKPRGDRYRVGGRGVGVGGHELWGKWPKGALPTRPPPSSLEA